ncbi:P-loop containing nucleoside triphosphate hydrolase protein [Polychaeton citri CBS 116435]|uniref:Ribosome-releasing factor 2, mitochondrial n=1 Tax=Polychaeton citri CBS 116435 TaxID=1314669 RepID=A0A9P4Q1K3_9PEZI|nr:P-loop containing nucleoside triphosphate hydrolase protein [Polychaeton citri CBS 116435]
MLTRWLSHSPAKSCLTSNPLRYTYRCCPSTHFSQDRPSQNIRHSSNAATKDGASSLDRTRNIGIIAHIDAGKTTTTERMLYYSGFTRRLGDVDEGSTVTDFLPAERARGITIQSAAITFRWPPGQQPSPGLNVPALSPDQPRSSVPHTINLIDTPGHADFTFEVLRSLRVLDGAVCILDGVAGVEAQTEKVWAQSAAYRIPRIVFVNKLDRDGAAFAQTVKEVGARLGVWPAVCGIPWWRDSGHAGLQGVGDVVAGRGLRYPDGGDGRSIEAFTLQQLEERGDEAFAEELRKAREALIELLSEHDEGIVEKYLEGGVEAITANDITESLRRCILAFPQAVAPVFAGASFRNVGVQPLLDAVVDLLPSPEERPDPEISFGGSVKGGLGDLLAGKLKLDAPSATFTNRGGKSSGNKSLSTNKMTFALQKLEACALAFKVSADARGAVLVYVRVYSGTLKRNTALWNTNLQTTERAQRLFRMHADDPQEIDAIEAGSIGAIPGLKLARTGDTLISYAGANPKTGPPAPMNTLQLRPIGVPPPVFFAAVEPNSLGEEKHIKECLDLLLREDPSLSVRVDTESGQTQLAGMGELHLEIAGNRLIQDLRAKARIGEVQIGYREALTESCALLEGIWEHEVGGKALKAGYHVQLSPRSEDAQHTSSPAGSEASEGAVHALEIGDNNRITLRTPYLDILGEPLENASAADIEPPPPLPPTLPIQAILEALKNGTLSGLASGPSHGFPLHSVDVIFTLDQRYHLFANTTTQALSSMARTVVRKTVRDHCTGGTTIMEPVMLATISVDEASLGDIVHDLSSARGGSIVSLDAAADETPMPGAESLSAQDSGIEVDVGRIYTPPDPFGSTSTTSLSSGQEGMQPGGTRMRQIVARVPLKEMVGYLKQLRSLTAGRGTFTMAVDRFEVVGSNRLKALVTGLRGSGF